MTKAQVRAEAYARFKVRFNQKKPSVVIGYLAQDMQKEYDITCGCCSNISTFHCHTKALCAQVAYKAGWYADRLHSVCPACQEDPKEFAKWLEVN